MRNLNCNFFSSRNFSTPPTQSAHLLPTYSFLPLLGEEAVRWRDGNRYRIFPCIKKQRCASKCSLSFATHHNTWELHQWRLNATQHKYWQMQWFHNFWTIPLHQFRADHQTVKEQVGCMIHHPVTSIRRWFQADNKMDKEPAWIRNPSEFHK